MRASAQQVGTTMLREPTKGASNIQPRHDRPVRSNQARLVNSIIAKRDCLAPLSRPSRCSMGEASA